MSIPIGRILKLGLHVGWQFDWVGALFPTYWEIGHGAWVGQVPQPSSIFVLGTTSHVNKTNGDSREMACAWSLGGADEQRSTVARGPGSVLCGLGTGGDLIGPRLMYGQCGDGSHCGFLM